MNDEAIAKNELQILVNNYSMSTWTFSKHESKAYQFNQHKYPTKDCKLINDYLLFLINKKNNIVAKFKPKKTSQLPNIPVPKMNPNDFRNLMRTEKEKGKSNLFQ